MIYEGNITFYLNTIYEQSLKRVLESLKSKLEPTGQILNTCLIFGKSPSCVKLSLSIV
jgi:hypothetical protein